MGMKRFAIALVAAVLLLGVVWWVSAETPPLKIGEKAPDFSLLGSDGRAHSLAAYRGRQVVVLAFYPKAFTGG
jgi:peroxiredoxin Q/BCP